MARVNRSTGALLILGVFALLATVAAPRLLINPAKLPEPPDPASQPAKEMDIFAGGQIDAPGGGLAYPVPGVPGRVAAILVKEDQHVKQGQVILQLDNETERMKLGAAEAALAAAKYKLEGSKSAVTMHESKLVEAQLQVKTAKSALKQIEIAIGELEKNLQLSKTAQSELKIKQAQKKDAQDHVEAAEQAYALLKQIDPKVIFKENEENLKKAEKDVEAAKAAIEMFSVKAPFDGRVISLNIRPGEQFGATAFGAPLPIVFCPDGDLIARAQVDQENAWKVKPGMKVTLKDKSPSRHHEWTGVVERVSPWLQKQRGNAFELDQMNDTRTRECIIRITPDPDNPLIIGQQMRVRIHVDSK